ncbi:hypothetical protein SAMN04487821_1508 [Enterococcus malodoratus]|uniref:hypothetical protein n=1 Tax=Enterococcus malodoratus TaxID=71451 RepID=UPI0008BE169C|nr:hypothetical protein [Enterococcus malodoratus]SEU02024.1 hypothetical protein SAMN04487821_1508 [Enterococcus malodoratus]
MTDKKKSKVVFYSFGIIGLFFNKLNKNNSILRSKKKIFFISAIVFALSLTCIDIVLYLFGHGIPGQKMIHFSIILVGSVLYGICVANYFYKPK